MSDKPSFVADLIIWRTSSVPNESNLCPSCRKQPPARSSSMSFAASPRFRSSNRPNENKISYRWLRPSIAAGSRKSSQKLVTERPAVGCIAWLAVGGYTSSQSLIDFKIMSGNNFTLIHLMHLFQKLLLAACLSALVGAGLIATWICPVVKNQQAGFGFGCKISQFLR
jgi:hypothetical protein